MNIFFLAYNPAECASYMVNKHVVKMILEYAQLLGAAHKILDKRDLPGVPRLSNTNHGCAKWVRESSANYKYLHCLFVATLNEKAFRFSSAHAYERLAKVLAEPPKNIKVGPMTPPMLAIGTGTTERSRDIEHAIEVYRKYYATNKAELFAWTKRSVPHWLTTKPASRVDVKTYEVPKRTPAPRIYKRWARS